MKKAYISIIVPLYNEVDNIPFLLDSIYIHFSEYDYELILVDDGSEDNSLAVINALKNIRTSIICLNKNYGQSTAFKAGLDIALGNIVAFLDGDLQNDSRDLTRLIEVLDNADVDLVQGFRKNRHDSLSKTIPSYIANKLISFVFKSKLNDIGCSSKAFKKEVIHDMYFFDGFHRYFSLIAFLKGYKVAELTINHFPRKHGTSKYGINRVFPVLIDLYRLKMHPHRLKQELKYTAAYINNAACDTIKV